MREDWAGGEEEEEARNENGQSKEAIVDRPPSPGDNVDCFGSSEVAEALR